ncbi:MAG: DUF424 family protein [Promethearchaeota archaeon]
MKCFIKIHSQSKDQVIGVCDENCLNMHLKQGKFSYHVSEAFFRGNLISIEEAIKYLKNSSNFNAVGTNIIKALIEAEIIHADGVIKIKDTPIAIKFIF